MNLFFIFTGLLDSITSTANSADCPGVCVHAFATLICYEVLEHVQCPTSMRCCIEAPINGTTSSSENSLDDTSLASTAITTVKTATMTTANTTTPPTTTAATTTSSMATPKTTSQVRLQDYRF